MFKLGSGYWNGIQNEQEILEAINGKKIQDLSPNLQKLVKKMFRSVDIFETIKVEQVPGFAKPDLKFTIGDESHYLSVKHGLSSQVHCEDISVFIDWLRKNNMSEHIIECYLRYHYADGTLDGSGKKRLSQPEALQVYKDEVEEINQAFNDDRFFVGSLFRRVMFEGNDPSKPAAEFIYHGDKEDGVICSKESVLSYAKTKREAKTKAPHFCKIVVRPYARYVNNDDTYPEKRHKVVFEWIRMRWDLEYINKYRY